MFDYMMSLRTAVQEVKTLMTFVFLWSRDFNVKSWGETNKTS